ncbi:hypothetical protein DID76_02785 [Candidatus Marinamargulisbacteria bacterium SCGC AG-414-C22]|nr:hypothetical protein DID76_02785 [Candidatus Marinamargulisbacteria bacterium SCGC AG-414-C22]
MQFKKIFFIHSISSLELLVKESTKDDSLIVVFSYSVYQKLISNNIRCKYVEDLIPEELYINPLELYPFTRDWWKGTSLEKLQKFLDVNLFEIINLEMFILFNNYYCDFLSGRYLVNHFQPGSIQLDIPTYNFDSFEINDNEYYYYKGILEEASCKGIVVDGVNVYKQAKTVVGKKNLVSQFLLSLHNCFWNCFVFFKEILFKPQVYVSISLYGLDKVLPFLHKYYPSLIGSGLKFPDFNMLYKTNGFQNIFARKLTRKNQELIKKFSLELEDSFKSNNVKNELSNVIVFENISLFSVIESRLPHLKEILTQLATDYLKCKQFLKHKKPNVIILNSYLIGQDRILSLASKNEESHVISIQNGVFTGNFHEFAYPVLVDSFLVFGEDAYSKLLKIDINMKNKLVKAGHPRFDSCFNSYSNTPLLIEEIGPYILYVTQTPAERWRVCGFHYRINDEEKIREYICNLLKINSTLKVIVKYRNLHEKDIWEASLKQYQIKSRIYLIQHYDLNILIKNSTAVILGFSTVGLETILNRVPLITLNMRKKDPLHNYEEFGAAFGVSSFDELNNTVNLILNANELTKREWRHNQEEYINKYYACKNSIEVLSQTIQKYL